MANVAKFNEELAVTLGLPAAILLKKLVETACRHAEQLEAETGYREGPLGVGASRPDPRAFPYLQPDQVDEGIRHLVGAGFVSEKAVQGTDVTNFYITKKALDVEDADGELEWKVYYKSSSKEAPNPVDLL